MGNILTDYHQEPVFPRNTMTKSLGHQKEAFNIKEVLKYFMASNYEDCRLMLILSLLYMMELIELHQVF